MPARKPQYPSPLSGDESKAAPPTPGAAPASDESRQEAWKQNWLNQADRRGAIWHSQWKEALMAKRTTKSGSSKRKKV